MPSITFAEIHRYLELYNIDDDKSTPLTTGVTLISEMVAVVDPMPYRAQSVPQHIAVSITFISLPLLVDCVVHVSGDAYLGISNFWLEPFGRDIYGSLTETIHMPNLKELLLFLSSPTPEADAHGATPEFLF